jgi:hypothetical protein
MRVSRPEYGIAAELLVLSAGQANPLRGQLNYFIMRNQYLEILAAEPLQLDPLPLHPIIFWKSVTFRYDKVTCL